MPKKAKTPIDKTPETTAETLSDAELEALTAPETDEAPADGAKPDEEASTEASEDAPAQDLDTSLSDSATDETSVSDEDGDAPQDEQPEAEGDSEGSTEAPVSQIAEDGQTIEPPADAPVTDEAPIAEQPSHDDALAQRPLSGHASAEMTGPIDAMPSEAQQHMGQWIKPPEEAEPAEPGQLPTAADLPGTPTDATGIGTQAQEPIASGTQGEAAHGEPSAEQIAANGTDKAPGEYAGAQPAESAEGADSAKGDEGDESPADDDGSLFGEPLPQHAPLFDVAGESLSEMKTAAEAAHRAAKSLTGFPVEVLDEAHKLLIVELRTALHSMVRATERVFTRKG